MWYWDFAPPSGHHAKKPLTKAQIRKLQEAYKNADKISAEVKEKENIEQTQTEQDIENLMKNLL